MSKPAATQKKPAAKRRKNSAHGASRGASAADHPAPEGLKNPSAASDELRLIPIPLADEIHPGDSLPDKLLASLRRRRLGFPSGDLLVVKHKIVSKSEGRLVDLVTIDPSAESIAWAK